MVQVGDDDPHVERKKAARALARTLSFHAVNLRTKEGLNKSTDFDLRR